MADGIKIGSAYVEISGDTSNLVEAQARALQEQKNFLNAQSAATAKATGVSQGAARKAYQDTARLLKALADQQLRDLVIAKNQEERVLLETARTVAVVAQAREREAKRATEAEEREARRSAQAQTRELARVEAAAKRAADARIREAKRAAEAEARETRRAESAQRRESERIATRSTRDTMRVIRSNQANDRREDAKAERELEQAINRRAKADEQAAAARARSLQNVRGQLAEAGKAVLGFGTIASGVTVAAITLRDAITGIADATAKQQQAQFAINELFGRSAPLVQQNAEALAKYAGVSKTEALEASAAVATLGRNYALSGEQINRVLKITADLAAVRGISLSEAATRVESAIRGEAEAIEYLGQSLQSGAVQALGRMTDEQRKYFETLSPITKAQIILNALQDQTANLTGAAGRRSETAAGQVGKLKGAIEDLSATLGGKYAKDIGRAAEALAGMVSGFEKLLELQPNRNILELANAAYGATNPFTLWAVAVNEVVRGLYGIATARREVNATANPNTMIGPDIGGEGIDSVGLNPAQLQATERIRAEQRQREAAEKDRISALVKRSKKMLDDIADAEEQAARRTAKAQEEAINQRILQLEIQQEKELRDLEIRERATLKSIEDEGRAREKAFEDQIERLEREKDLRQRAAEEARDQAEKALEDTKRQLDRQRELEDRGTDEQRRAEDRAVDALREKQDRALEDSHRATLRRLETEHETRVQNMEDEKERIQERNKKAEREFEREIERIREASKKRIDSIEKAIQREDDNHRRRLEDLEAEQDVRLKILDSQLKALDTQQKAEQSVRRMLDLQKALSEAQKEATQARGTGTPEQVAEARGALTAAIRVGDPVSIANAQERLIELAGKGAAAIKDADEKLAEAQEAIRQEGVEQTRDALREELTAKKDSIKEEMDARKKAEDERHRQRERELRVDIDSEQKSVERRIKAVNRKKELAKEEVDRQIKELDRRKDAEDKEYELAREREDDRFRENKQRIEDMRILQDQELEDRRRKSDQDREDFRAVEDEKFRLQQEAIKENYRQERLAIEEHFNGPNGSITTTRKAMEASKELYRQRLEDARLKFQEEQRLIKEVYQNTAKTGLIDLQNQAAQNNQDKLASQIAAIASWKEEAGRMLEENAAKWRSVAEAIQEVNQAIKDLPDTSGINTAAPSGNRNGTTRGTKPRESGGSSASSSGNAPSGGSSGSSGGGGGSTGSGDQGGTYEGPGIADPPTSSDPTTPENQAYSPVVLKAKAGTAWFGGGTHAGPNGEDWPAVDIMADKGTPIYAPVSGRSSPAYGEEKSGYYTILYGNDGRAYFMAHGNVPFKAGIVRRGEQIGEVGNTGNAIRTDPHVHFAIGSNANVFGERGGSGDIKGDSSYWKMRDGGYRFTNPTLTLDTRTGERGILAERGPERLLGREQTARMEAVARASGVQRPYHQAGGALAGYSEMAMAGITAGMGSSGKGGNTYHRTINVNGVGLSEVADQIRRTEHREELLTGVRR